MCMFLALGLALSLATGGDCEVRRRLLFLLLPASRVVGRAGIAAARFSPLRRLTAAALLALLAL